jgi:hypothetical protein
VSLSRCGFTRGSFGKFCFEVPGGLPSSYRDGGPPVGGDTILNASDGWRRPVYHAISEAPRGGEGLLASGHQVLMRRATNPNTGTVL